MSKCKKQGGRFQSPININTKKVNQCNKSCNLKFSYKKSICRIKNRNNNIIVKYNCGSYIIFNSHKYILKKISFTVPGSHKIDGTSAPVELQLYHRSPKTNVKLVISVLIDVNNKKTRSKSFFNSFVPFIPIKNKQKRKLKIKNWNVIRAIPKSKAFYTYEGSLLFPPYNEKIIWIVMNNSVNMNKKCYRILKSVIGKNNRSIQKRCKRIVSYNSGIEDMENVEDIDEDKEYVENIDEDKEDVEDIDEDKDIGQLIPSPKPCPESEFVKSFKNFMTLYLIFILVFGIVFLIRKFGLIRKLFAYLDIILLKYTKKNIRIISE